MLIFRRLKCLLRQLNMPKSDSTVTNSATQAKQNGKQTARPQRKQTAQVCAYCLMQSVFVAAIAEQQTLLKKPQPLRYNVRNVSVLVNSHETLDNESLTVCRHRAQRRAPLATCLLIICRWLRCVRSPFTV